MSDFFTSQNKTQSSALNEVEENNSVSEQISENVSNVLTPPIQQDDD